MSRFNNFSKIVMTLLILSAAAYSEEERLDKDKEVKVNLTKFTTAGGWYTTGQEMVPVSESDPAFVEVIFPAEWNIVKMIIYSGKTKYSNGIDGTKDVATMYNFEIQTKNKHDEFRLFRSYSQNTVTKIEIKEKVAAKGVRIKIMPVRFGSDKTFGSVAFEIWGFKGPIPKQEKIKIKTKEDAKKALKLNEITPAEYMQLLKALPE